jgi:hypothetical protein
MKVTHRFPRALSGEGTRCKLSLIMVLSAFLACPLRAQASASEPPPAPPQSAPQQLSQEELKNLVAPVALYPDALIAFILPASSVPSDLVLAERYIASNGDLTQIANQPWDDSVKSLVRYPDVLKWMDQNLEWTTTLGGFLINQPDVMNSFKPSERSNCRWQPCNSPAARRQERACVRIVPAQPDDLCANTSEVVYVQPYSGCRAL